MKGKWTDDKVREKLGLDPFDLKGIMNRERRAGRTYMIICGAIADVLNDDATMVLIVEPTEASVSYVERTILEFFHKLHFDHTKISACLKPEVSRLTEKFPNLVMYYDTAGYKDSTKLLRATEGATVGRMVHVYDNQGEGPYAAVVSNSMPDSYVISVHVFNGETGRVDFVPNAEYSPTMIPGKTTWCWPPRV